MRNPKDVLISLYYYCYIFNGYKDPESMEAFLEEFLCGNGMERVPFGSWFEHVKGWMEMKGKPNFFFITYEELQKDLRGSVERIIQFLGKELSSQQIDSVIENASFQKMKDNSMSNLSWVPEPIFNHEKGNFLRKGISGDWKKHLTVAQSECFDHIYQEKMQGVNVTFPWN
ncbi:hypothetical protein JD844_005642 [Phrynosoma platyrhinos]|uniref:Sulfotransferase n=1 Tax=Phrynosoma platyrhinos TaxID=52577 RepID=A0ABQ7TNI2_PHRPL|nr:hypothetical protein JD844_005642 [Phrynosoma platyrhinos]